MQIYTGSRTSTMQAKMKLLNHCFRVFHRFHFYEKITSIWLGFSSSYTSNDSSMARPCRLVGEGLGDVTCTSYGGGFCGSGSIFWPARTHNLPRTRAVWKGTELPSNTKACNTPIGAQRNSKAKQRQRVDRKMQTHLRSRGLRVDRPHLKNVKEDGFCYLKLDVWRRNTLFFQLHVSTVPNQKFSEPRQQMYVKSSLPTTLRSSRLGF